MNLSFSRIFQYLRAMGGANPKSERTRSEDSKNIPGMVGLETSPAINHAKEYDSWRCYHWSGRNSLQRRVTTIRRIFSDRIKEWAPRAAGFEFAYVLANTPETPNYASYCDLPRNMFRSYTGIVSWLEKIDTCFCWFESLLLNIKRKLVNEGNSWMEMRM